VIQEETIYLHDSLVLSKVRPLVGLLMRQICVL